MWHKLGDIWYVTYHMLRMFLPVVGAITITCSSIKSKNFRIRMWIIKYISIVVLNGIVIAKIRITWFDGTEVTMTDVCVWIYIFWNMSHCKGSQVRPPCVTFESMSHDSMSHTTKYYSINYFRNWTFPRCTGGTMRSTAVIQSQMKKMIHEIPESCWNRNSRSFPNQFHHSSGNQNYDSELKTFQRQASAEIGRHCWKTADSHSTCQCSILMFYLEFRGWKFNFVKKRISNWTKIWWTIW